MTEGYRIENIRTLLTEGFSEEELRHLCYDEPDFRSVRHRLAQINRKAEIIDRLLEYAEQKMRLEKLLAWAGMHNSER